MLGKSTCNAWWKRDYAKLKHAPGLSPPKEAVTDCMQASSSSKGPFPTANAISQGAVLCPGTAVEWHSVGSKLPTRFSLEKCHALVWQQ